VEIETDNSDGKLLPYLTANVQFEVSRLHNVMLVPNAALRFEPMDTDEIAPDARASLGGRGTKGEGAGGDSAGSDNDSAAADHRSNHPASHSPRTLILSLRMNPKPPGPADGSGSAIPTRTSSGPSACGWGRLTGAFSEVQSDKLSDGMELVTGEIRPDAPAASSGAPGNPFVPQMPRRGPGGGGGGGGGGGR